MRVWRFRERSKTWEIQLGRRSLSNVTAHSRISMYQNSTGPARFDPVIRSALDVEVPELG